MPAEFTRADSLREYLTGASSDGGTQADSNASFGHYRSATEVASLGIVVTNAITGVTVLFAGGSNPVGAGTLTAVDGTHLTWQPADSTVGSSATFSGTGDTEIVESGDSPGQYLRVTGDTPFTPGSCTVTLSYLLNNFYGFDDVSTAQAGAGENQYRAVMIRNESSGTVTSVQRCIALLGTPRTSDGTQLGGSGSGTITTSGSLADWPVTGWCQVRNSGGTLKEVIYYTSRTATALTVPSAGRGLLGTSATAGASSDSINPVPGIALAIDTAGVQNFGTSIQTIADANTAPTSVTWNLGITAATGLQIGDMAINKQVGVWIWRQIPAGSVASPQVLSEVSDSFNAA